MSVRFDLRNAAVELVRQVGTDNGWATVPVLGRKRLGLLESETPPRVLVTVTVVGRERARAGVSGRPDWYGYYDLVIGYYNRSVGIAQDEAEVDSRAENIRTAVEIDTLTDHGATRIDDIFPYERDAYEPGLLSDSYDVTLLAWRVRTLEPDPLV